MPSALRLASAAGAVIVLLALSASPASAEGSSALVAHSFKPPYNTYDFDGKRQIPNYSYGGSVEVNENFIRLTPDRASKKGWVWARSPLDGDVWSATLKFRVSGQGKRLFGDGFALWFTQSRFITDGPLHGFTDKYTGFGVVFDTFRNTELSHVHKDVAVYVNDGSTLDPATLKDVIGCDADLRFWEGRDDFSVANKSLARVTFSHGKLSVDIDAKGKGVWTQCVKDVPVSLPTDWHKAAYIGLTATTGQLADNHDLLAMTLSTNPDEPQADTAAAPAALPSSGNPQLDALVQAAVDKEVKALADKLTDLHHLLEHQLSAVNDGLQNNIKKLQEQDANNVKRIVELETKLHMKVEDDVHAKVNDALDATLEGRLQSVEELLHEKFNLKLQHEVVPNLDRAVEAHLEGAGGGWKIPFFILLVVIAAVGAFGYSKYKHLTKTHLL